jgi:hypothetical protein
MQHPCCLIQQRTTRTMLLSSRYIYMLIADLPLSISCLSLTCFCKICGLQKEGTSCGKGATSSSTDPERDGVRRTQDPKVSFCKKRYFN